MAKKKTPARKPSGAAAIESIDELSEETNGTPLDDIAVEAEVRNGHHESAPRKAAKPKKKPETQSGGGFGAAEFRKAATFANSVGGLDKAIALLHLLKIAKEVQ